MKKLLQIALVMVIGYYASGCASTYNHLRVKEEVCKEAITISGTAEQKQLLAQGVSARKIVKFSAITGADGSPEGVKVMLATDLKVDLIGAIRDSIASYIDTYKEAPISSSVALGLDIATAIAVIQAADSGGGGGGSSSTTTAADLPAGSIVINGDNSGKLDTVGGTAVVQGDNTGNINTAAMPEEEE